MAIKLHVTGAECTSQKETDNRYKNEAEFEIKYGLGALPNTSLIFRTSCTE